MIRPNKAFKDALRITLSGTVTVLFSTVTSCALAITIEGAANRTLYRFFPHWYDNVQYAYGIPHLQEQKQSTHNSFPSGYEDEDRIRDSLQTNHASITPNSSSTSLSALRKYKTSLVASEMSLGEPYWSDSVDDEIHSTFNNGSLSVSSTTTTRDNESHNNNTKRASSNYDQISKMVHSCALTAG